MAVDVVPMDKGGGDGGVGLRVGILQVAQGAVGEYDAPAESAPTGVTLEHTDIVSSIPQLHLNGKVESGRPAAEDVDFHRVHQRSVYLPHRRVSTEVDVPAAARRGA